MEQWEYQKEYMTEEHIPARLNEWGDLGWELVSLASCTIAIPMGWGGLTDDAVTQKYLAVFKHRKGMPRPAGAE